MRCPTPGRPASAWNGLRGLRRHHVPGEADQLESPRRSRRRPGGRLRGDDMPDQVEIVSAHRGAGSRQPPGRRRATSVRRPFVGPVVPPTCRRKPGRHRGDLGPTLVVTGYDLDEAVRLAGGLPGQRHGIRREPEALNGRGPAAAQRDGLGQLGDPSPACPRAVRRLRDSGFGRIHGADELRSPAQGDHPASSGPRSA